MFSALLLVAIAAPLAAGVLSLIGPRRIAEVWSYPASVLTLLSCLVLMNQVRSGSIVSVSVLPILPGLDLMFRADALGLTFATLSSGLWLVSAIYSSGYVRADQIRHRPRYFAAFAAAIGAAVGVAFAGNLLTFLIFYEMLTLTTYPLVVHKQTPEAIAAGRRYLLFALSGGMLLTFAIAWTWFAVGTLDFVPGGFLAGRVSQETIATLFVLFLAGCGVKAAIMPLHSWLPAAMVAPSPVSALLHAVAVVKAGVFGCIRMLGFVFGPAALQGTSGLDVLTAICAITIVAGSLMALRQDNLKRRLAYSTVVQLSYVVIGATFLTPQGMTGSVLHMVNHGLAKITLFFCAGAIYATTHIENISDMRGLGRRMPWTFAAFTVASLGLIGTPGLCGFVSKFFLASGAMKANEVLYLAVLLGASLLTASYLLPILRIAYFEQPDPAVANAHHEHHHAGEARPSLVVPLLVTALLVLVFGIVPAALGVQYDLAATVAQQVFANGAAPELADAVQAFGAVP